MAENLSNRDASRSRILDAARRIFLEVGFEEANLDEVARLADVAKGTIYRYFASKAELYVEVLVYNADAFVERMRMTVDPALSPDEQILETGRFYVRHYAEHPEYFRIFWAVENQRMIGALPDSLVEVVRNLWRNCLEIVVEMIENGVKGGIFRPCNAWETANLLWIVANGLVQTETDPERRALRGGSLEEIVTNAFSLVVRGMRAEST